MDQAQARALLAGERGRLQRLLQAATSQPPTADQGDEVDDADRRNTEQTGMAIDQLLRARWAALQRAEARLATGNYGRSVQSGQPIPDQRLEADPLAELTLEEAAAAQRGALEEDDDEPAPEPSLGIQGSTTSRRWSSGKSSAKRPVRAGLRGVLAGGRGRFRSCGRCCDAPIWSSDVSHGGRSL